MNDPGTRGNIDQGNTGLNEPAIQNFPPLKQVRKQSLPLQWLCLAALGVGEIINLTLRAVLYTQTFNNTGIDLTAVRGILLESNYGHLWIARIVLIGMALGLLAWTSRSSRKASTGLRSAVSSRSSTSAGYTIAMLALAGLIVFTLALSDDITQLAQAHASAAMLDWLYLVAQGIWFGGAAYLGFILLPLLPALEPELHAQSLVTLIRRSVPLFAGSMGVLLVSGLFLAETSLSNTQQLLTDPFGRALLVKIVVVAVMLLVSIYALFFLMPHLRRQVLLLHVVNREMPARRMRQAALERNEKRLAVFMKTLACLGVGALLCTAFMAFFAPPIVFSAVTYTNSSDTSTASSTTGTQAIQTEQVGDLTVHLQVNPALTSFDNTVIVTLNKSNGTPVTNARVRMTINMLVMDMGTSNTVIDGGNPSYVAVFKKGESFSMPGLWNIALNIQRPNQAPAQVSFQVAFSA